jgi:hypothetical protein
LTVTFSQAVQFASLAALDREDGEFLESLDP